MSQNIKEIYGNKIAALDGDIGHVKDFYFDDKTWVIRYVVVDTGSWLSGRLVLLSPHAFGGLDQHEKVVHVKLHKKQIENSPAIETHKPVSRQYEMEYYKYYGWPAYWNGGALWGMGGFPIMLPPSKDEMAALLQHHHRDDKHLRSSKAVNGYVVRATDGEIGNVTGFLMNGRSWAIDQLTVETGHWYSGKEIVVPVQKIDRISSEESTVFVNLTKATVEQTAENGVVKGGLK